LKRRTDCNSLSFSAMSVMDEPGGRGAGHLI
jgi:hypothetical protein